MAMDKKYNRQKSKPQWQLPKGVSHGLWDYTQSDFIAEDYDEYFSYTHLFELDQGIVLDTLKQFGQPGELVADLGCGTGRALEPVCQAGYRGLAIDLSWPMLEIVQQKAKQQNLDIYCLRANLVELGILADNSVNHCICLFSTLGMISGSENRQMCVNHIARILKPGGHAVIEVGEVVSQNEMIFLEREMAEMLPLEVQGGGRVVAQEICINQQEFTKLANCWKVTNNSRGTNTNRCLVIRKEA